MAINKKLTGMTLGAFLALGLGTITYLHDDLNEDILLYSTLDSKTAITKPQVGIGGIANSVTFTTGQVNNGARIVCEKTCLDAGTKRFISFPVDGNINLDQGEIIFWFKPDYSSSADQARRTLFSIGVDGYNPPTMLLEESDALTFSIIDSNWDRISTSAPYNSPLWSKGEWVKIRIRWDNKSTDSLVIFVGETRVDQKTGTGGWSIKNINLLASRIFIGALNSNGEFPAKAIFDEFIIRSPMPPSTTTDAEIGLPDASAVVDSGVDQDAGMTVIDSEVIVDSGDGVLVDSEIKIDAETSIDAGIVVDSGETTSQPSPTGGFDEPKHPTGFRYDPPGASLATSIPTLPKPNFGERISDPVFGTTIRRISDKAIPIYSQLQAFTYDNKYVMMVVVNGNVEIKKYPELTPVSTTGMIGSAHRWIPQTHKILTLDGLPVKINSFDVDTGVSTEIIKLPEFNTAGSSRSWEELSEDGRWMGLMGRKLDGTRFFMAVDLVNKRIGASIQLETFCPRDPQWGDIEPDWVAASPLGKYLLIQWLGSGACSGLRSYDINTGEFVAEIYQHHNHSDRGIDTDGKEYMMTTTIFHPDNNNVPAIAIHYLDGSGMKILRMTYWGSADHYSCRGPRGICLVSAGDIVAGPQLAPFEQELFLQYTDGRAKRLVHHRSTGCQYWVLPKASWSFDGKNIIWSSDWNNCSDPAEGAHGSGYVLEDINP